MVQILLQFRAFIKIGNRGEDSNNGYDSVSSGADMAITQWARIAEKDKVDAINRRLPVTGRHGWA